MLQRYGLLLLIVLFKTSILFSQTYSRKDVNQLNTWYNPNIVIKFHKNVGLFLDGQLRFNGLQHGQQHQMRVGLEFYYGNFTFTPLGYVYTWNYVYGKQPAAVAENEHRAWEQVQFKHSASRFFFVHRVRLEQRWIEHKLKNADGDYYVHDYIYKNRFRYRLTVNIPLNHATMAAKTVYLQAAEEVFISFGKNVTYNLPDQNRVYLGLGYKFNNYGSVNLGYLNQLILKSDGLKAELNHTIVVGFSYELDLPKLLKKKK